MDIENGTPNPCGPCCDALAPLFKALGDGTRLAIVDLLGRVSAPLCVCDIEARFDLSQPTISHHLRLLREAGLVTAERRGTWMHYTLAPAGLTALREFTTRLAAATKGARS